MRPVQGFGNCHRRSLERYMSLLDASLHVSAGHTRADACKLSNNRTRFAAGQTRYWPALSQQQHFSPARHSNNDNICKTLQGEMAECRLDEEAVDEWNLNSRPCSLHISCIGQTTHSHRTFQFKIALFSTYLHKEATSKSSDRNYALQFRWPLRGRLKYS